MRGRLVDLAAAGMRTRVSISAIGTHTYVSNECLNDTPKSRPCELGELFHVCYWCRSAPEPELLLTAPAEHHRIERAPKFQQPGTRRRMQRMPHRLALDYAAFGHDRLRRAQAALPVLEVDQRQDPAIGRGRFRAPAGM